MDCREFLRRYSDYDDSLVPPEEADRFRRHMDHCPSCARYDRVLRKGRMLARQAPKPKPGPDFVPRLQLRLRQGRGGGRSGGRGVGGRGARMAAGLAAATVLMVAATAVRLLVPAPDGGVAELRRFTAPARVIRPATIPALAARRAGSLEAWTVKEVDPAEASSYSPLVTGPPVYRVSEPSPYRTTDADRRALD